ncbi:MAG TPA: hypothetical protein DDZ91_15255 [Firmicutes bacterium]|jgi:biopolymer transport protein ExbD|nr:hypothetical protein [Bacillota bacterium]
MSKKQISLRPLPQPRVEIINLIDVLITLIAFFMLTTVFAEQHRRLELELPVVQHTESIVTLPEHDFLLLELEQSGLIYYQGSQVSVLALSEILRLEDPLTPILVRADRDCRYEAVVRIIDLLTDAGLRRLALEVKEQPSDK